MILAAAGDIPSSRRWPAAWRLRRLTPDLRVRVMNVAFAVHGYRRVIHQVVHGHADVDRIRVRGFNEEGHHHTVPDAAS
jgi:xylulose-5-phosphate/fructose-6-phosphate phosphoketolase